ncbi:MAG: hypothetical protein Q8R40_06670 [bacterium]|nr:hypothetical protein [bacterium]
MSLYASPGPTIDILHSSCCVSLTEEEKRAIFEAKASADTKELLAIKHMAERFVGVECESSAMLWVFYLPDFTRLFKDWYCLYIKKIFEIYTPDASACIHDDGDGYVLLRYKGERPRDIVLHEILNGNWDYVTRLLERAKRSELSCMQQIDRFENFLCKHTDAFDFEAFMDALSTFAGYGLDTLFPETLVEEMFPHVDVSALYHSPLSSWGMLLEGMLTHLEMVYAKKITEETAIDRYADTISYLRWGDIESHENDLAFTRKLFMQEKRSYPSFAHIAARSQRLYEEKRIFGMPTIRYQMYLEKFACELDASLKMSFFHLAEFATKAQQYNELRRILFTKSLRLMRELCEQMSLDWRSVSISALIENAGRKIDARV